MRAQRPHLVNIEALHAGLDTRRAADGLSWREMGRVIGVSASTSPPNPLWVGICVGNWWYC